ncbi:MAG: hypothetical protein DHS20C02_19210 [Micavibrio sp.]|nr:MAG: hypothetical protein DHS20C02_19210 [Micavibrio sp.]
MPTATETTLTATEKYRVQKFNVDRDDKTASAMMSLFIFTKHGCDAAAYELMEVAHGHYPRVSESVIGALFPLGLVRRDGTVSEAVSDAVQDAVDGGYLVMRGPKDPTPEHGMPDRHYE